MSIWYLRLGCLVAIYALQRLLFIFFNFNSLSSVPLNDWFFAFADGFRFDACAIATLNAPIIFFQYFFLLAPRRNLHSDRAKLLNRRINWIFGGFFLAVNIPMLVFGFIDIRLFAFTGRRMTAAWFDLMGDVQGQAFGLLTQYWGLTAVGLLTIFGFSWLSTRHVPELQPITSKRREVLVLTVFFLIAAVVGRGGFQTKPLLPAHAYRHRPVALANLVLNSSMTILRTPSSKALKELTDLGTMHEVRSVLDVPTSSKTAATGKNVVVIVVESLACEYMGFFNEGQGYTPFLDSLAANAVTFRQSFANGRRSIDAMPAIFAGVPAWTDQPFITSPYASNQILPLPSELKKFGYSSAFFHGAATGSMHFDIFAKMAGFENYYGKEDYPEKSDDDGQWGIFDEPFLVFSAKKMSEMPKPFFTGIFTLSSHNPFKIPEKYQGKFPKGSLAIHESIGYADYSLRQFFQFAASEPWFENTIFVITGDHTSLSSDVRYGNYLGRFKVPIIFYAPKISLPKSAEAKIASHIDISPTIFHLLGVKTANTWALGGPLFEPSWKGRFIQNEHDTWLYLDDQRQITLSQNGDVKFFSTSDTAWASELSETPDDVTRLRLLKASRQYFINGLISNSWL